MSAMADRTKPDAITSLLPLITDSLKECPGKALKIITVENREVIYIAVTNDSQQVATPNPIK